MEKKEILEKINKHLDSLSCNNDIASLYEILGHLKYLNYINKENHPCSTNKTAK